MPGADPSAQPWWWPFGARAREGGKLRKVPIKVEPKVFFANERTFLAWLHMSTILGGFSLGILALADYNAWSQIYGLILLPVAIAFTAYSLHTYLRRVAMIQRRDPGPYEDRVGPVILTGLLIMAIFASFSVKLYAMSA